MSTSAEQVRVPLELVDEVRDIVALGGVDEEAAVAAFHRLIDAHGCAVVGAALVAAPEALAESPYRDPVRAADLG